MIWSISPSKNVRIKCQVTRSVRCQISRVKKEVWQPGWKLGRNADPRVPRSKNFCLPWRIPTDKFWTLFILMQFSGAFGRIIGWCPWPLCVSRPTLGNPGFSNVHVKPSFLEFLDPPLMCNVESMTNYLSFIAAWLLDLLRLVRSVQQT